ncbi:unnamed protein product [Trichogramma brassicae]|uniref:Uncharacterized protein n=1 Tax=Trichogramma brassicae TaxID=86971 RepID=A0A6H5INT7_9HYME|nr:unnamed protein product [Trichogramma brassicae]
MPSTSSRACLRIAMCISPIYEKIRGLFDIRSRKKKTVVSILQSSMQTVLNSRPLYRPSEQCLLTYLRICMIARTYIQVSRIYRFTGKDPRAEKPIKYTHELRKTYSSVNLPQQPMRRTALKKDSRVESAGLGDVIDRYLLDVSAICVTSSE